MDAQGDDIIFEGEGWTLRGAGLEHANGYFIDRHELAARRSDGLWAWPLQMAEKAWCAPQAFIAAFLRALDAFGIEADARLGPSLAALRHGGGRTIPPTRDARALADWAKAVAAAAGRRVPVQEPIRRAA